MFITKKALPRRTLLRGMGAALALPLLDAMIPALGAQLAARPVRRFGALYVPHGMLLSQWVPQTHRRRLRLHADPQAARALQGPADAGQRPDRRADCAERRSRGGAGLLSQRQHPAEADRRLRRLRCRDGRSGDREGGGTRDAVPVARNRHRGFQHLDRRLRHRLQLHLHEHDLLGGPDVAAADGDQPAGAVRTHVRWTGQRRRSVWRGCRRTAASWTASRRR